MKKISEFLLEFFHFLVVKFSVYLNRHVFVMIAISLLGSRELVALLFLWSVAGVLNLWVCLLIHLVLKSKLALRKHAYLNILRILPPKTKIFR